MKRTAVKPSLANAAIFGQRFPHTNTTIHYFYHTIQYKKTKWVTSSKFGGETRNQCGQATKMSGSRYWLFPVYICHCCDSILRQKRGYIGAGGNAKACAFSGATERADGRGETQQLFPRHPL